jgi:hypothetical protein
MKYNKCAYCLNFEQKLGGELAKNCIYEGYECITEPILDMLTSIGNEKAAGRLRDAEYAMFKNIKLAGYRNIWEQ